MKVKCRLTLIVCLFIQLDFSSSSSGSVLTNHDFCMKQASECSGNFKYECKPDKCSVDKTACSYFNSMIFVLNSYRSRASYAEDKKRFNTFKILIAKCPVIRYEWKAADFCLNKLKDCKTRDIDIITGTQKIKIVDCPCDGMHSYKCGKNVCSIDKISCNFYQRNASKMAQHRKAVSECNKKRVHFSNQFSFKCTFF